jgi:hypothetical protein
MGNFSDSLLCTAALSFFLNSVSFCIAV